MSETSVNILMMDTFQTLIRRGSLAQCNHSPQGQWGPWVSLTAVGVTPPLCPQVPPPRQGAILGPFWGLYLAKRLRASQGLSSMLGGPGCCGEGTWGEQHEENGGEW